MSALTCRFQDWPPTADFAQKFPEIFDLFEDCLIGPWITSRRGPLNLETNMPVNSCPPDTGPKAYLAHGAAGGTTTRLHCDVTDATNMMFHAEKGSKGGAVWTMIDRNDMSRAGQLLSEWKRGSFGEGHPIHSQQLHLTDEDVQALRLAKVRVWTLVQRPGEAVFIPAGVGHQVTNLTPCIKIAVDFVTSVNVSYSQKISEELREHRLACGDRDSEDVLQLASMCWWTYQRWKMENLAETRSDPNSNPWISTYSAAPVYMPVSLHVNERATVAARGENDYDYAPDGSDLSNDPTNSIAQRPVVDDGEAASSLTNSQAPALSSPTPIPRAAVSSSTLLPCKRPNADEALTKTQKRRLKKARSVYNQSLLDAAKTLSCPIGGCKRANDMFDRRNLLNHLESIHRDNVLFLHDRSSAEMVEKRKLILGTHLGDDAAFAEYLSSEVLNIS
ncbi:unnamed protein product [Peniophora sp. CBMAI 1063]|nr:unnamed protein product [Peniophora sp. CBMAI 1063]